VPPFETGGGLHGASAAIEFGVLGLEVKHIVVVGHGQCGGIKAALEHSNPASGQNIFIDDWMGIVSDARDAVLARAPVDPQRALEMEAVKVSLHNLRTFPFIAEREASGELKLHGAWFAIAEGSLYVLDEDSGEFTLPQ
jgi:carbonic anhydrase